MSQLTEKVSFDLIRYANCWEDADILLKGLDPKPGSRILSIASAGDNSFSLLVTDPEVVVAVDVNTIQLHLIELKKAAIALLEYEQVLAFLGFRECADRLALFDRIKHDLSPEARLYWEKNREQLASGIVFEGKFEKYFRLFVRRILPWIHTQKRVEALLAPKPAEAQRQFYAKKWDTWRWRFLFKIFFSRYVMGKYGRDPEFLKEVEVSVGRTICEKAGKHLQSTGAQTNFMLRYNLTASFGDLLPHYLQPENFAVIRQRLDRLKLVNGYAEDAIRIYGTFHCMNLSNIFEYMSPEVFRQVSGQLVRATEKGGRLAYWNLLVPRHVAASFPQDVNFRKEDSERLTASDKGFFYNRFIIDEIT